MTATLLTDSDKVIGKEQKESLEPARNAHIDYTLRGLRDSARYCRKDIKEAAQHALDAEDMGEEAPRYAAYSVWVRHTSSSSSN